MKRHFLLLLGFVITFTSFVSCDDNDAPESSVCEVVVKSGGNGSVAITNNTGTTVNNFNNTINTTQPADQVMLDNYQREVTEAQKSQQGNSK